VTTYSFNYVVLDDPARAGATVAFGINNLGQIVGYYLGSDGNDHGFVYNNGGYTSLDDPATSSGTVATGINDSGQIAGNIHDASGHGQGFLDSGGTFTTLAAPSAPWARRAQN
jgi:probable HAF family extracellular repeat protein